MRLITFTCDICDREYLEENIMRLRVKVGEELRWKLFGVHEWIDICKSCIDEIRSKANREDE